MANTTIEDVLKKHIGEITYNNAPAFRNDALKAMQEWASLQTPSNEKYWRERCEAAEALVNSLEYYIKNDKYMYKGYKHWQQLKSQDRV